jgi:hypothetical protein
MSERVRECVMCIICALCECESECVSECVCK